VREKKEGKGGREERKKKGHAVNWPNTSLSRKRFGCNCSGQREKRRREGGGGEKKKGGTPPPPAGRHRYGIEALYCPKGRRKREGGEGEGKKESIPILTCFVFIYLFGLIPTNWKLRSTAVEGRRKERKSRTLQNAVGWLRSTDTEMPVSLCESCPHLGGENEKGEKEGRKRGSEKHHGSPEKPMLKQEEEEGKGGKREVEFTRYNFPNQHAI